MKSPVLPILLSVVAGAVAGVVAVRVAPAPAAENHAAALRPESGDTQALAALDRRLGAIEEGLEAMRMDVGALQADVQRRARAPHPVEPPDMPPSEAGPRGAALAAPADATAQSAFDELMGGHVEWERAQALWKEVAKAGRTDELVKAFEARAKQRGNDPDAQMELGQAYLQKLFTVGQGPEAGTWAMKADRAFDAALVLDDHHWGARFQKAMSLSFWPAVFGKQQDAVQQFETLAAQQAEVAPQPHFAQTYLLLGNLHTQMGHADQALAAWQQGLAMFPNDPELQAKVQAAQGH